MVKKADIPDHVIDTALRLAGERGWRRLRLADIAAEAKLPLSAVVEAYGSKAAIAAAFSRRIDRAVAAGTDLADLAEPAQERLHDVLMRRFDALGPYRAGVRAIACGAARDPVAGGCAGAALLRSMAAMLEAAGISAAGLGGLLRTKGLAAIYVATFRDWLGDESEDQARTMDALKRRLDRADWVMSRLCARRRPRAAGDGAPPAEAAGARGDG